VEDLAVICVTVVLPAFGGSGDHSFLKAAWTLGKALLFLIPLIFLAIKVTLWTAVAVASGPTQIGELSFVVVRVARSAGMVGENVFSTAIAASLISIFLNVFILRGVFGWASRKFPAQGQMKLAEYDASPRGREESALLQ
jgi:Kef-type K+ transport system membrane component KefB